MHRKREGKRQREIERDKKRENVCHQSQWNLSTTSECKEGENKKKQESSNDANNGYKSLLINDCICIFFFIFFGIAKKAADKKTSTETTKLEASKQPLMH